MVVFTTAGLIAAATYVGGAATAFEISNEIAKFNAGESTWNSSRARAESNLRRFREGCADGSILSKDCPDENVVGEQVGGSTKPTETPSSTSAIPPEYIVIGFFLFIFIIYMLFF